MKLLLENWRKYLAEETELEEGIGAFVPGSSEYKMNKAVKQLKKELADEKHKTSWERIAQELKETQEAWRLLKKWKTLGDFEKEFVWDQIKDVAPDGRAQRFVLLGFVGFHQLTLQVGQFALDLLLALD